MTVFLTSDTHFNHPRVLTVEKNPRPFSSVEEMNEVMVTRWNDRITNSDQVYHLGDFVLFGDMDPFLQRLKGQKFLIKGNHDTSERLRKATLWQEVYDVKEIKVDKTRLFLFHYACRTWHHSHKGVIHLYGHSHGNLPGDSQSLDVGVDAWDFRPVTLEEVKSRLATNPQRIEIDHHQTNSDD